MTYSFSEFSLDPDAFELTRDTDKIAVEPQAFSLLQFLIENRDRVVSKDELIEKVWDGRIVSDAALNSCVNAARRAVSDNGKAQAVIKTFPRRGFRFVAEVSNITSTGKRLQPERGAPTQSDGPSIAVLPFDNLSADPEQDYFSDGMAEDLITDLSKISNLYVAARNSTFAFKGRVPEVREIADKLGVAFILEGSVRRMGERLRINAQLINAADGGHVWAERYDGELTEIFEFQDRIREKIVAALRLKLTPADKTRTERRRTENIDAYDLFLKGRQNYFRYAPESLAAAIGQLEKAIELDPGFADAYGYLSYCTFASRILRWLDYDETLENALSLAERAVSLDPESALAHTRLGWILGWMRRYDEAFESFETALSLQPDLAETHTYYGELLNFYGDYERALELCQRAYRLDPLQPPSWEYHLGHAYLGLGRLQEAIDNIQSACARAPKFIPARLYLTFAYAESDRMQDARAQIETVRELNPSYTIAMIRDDFPFRQEEECERFLDAIRRAGLPEK